MEMVAGADLGPPVRSACHRAARSLRQSVELLLQDHCRSHRQRHQEPLEFDPQTVSPLALVLFLSCVCAHARDPPTCRLVDKREDLLKAYNDAIAEAERVHGPGKKFPVPPLKDQPETVCAFETIIFALSAVRADSRTRSTTPRRLCRARWHKITSIRPTSRRRVARPPPLGRRRRRRRPAPLPVAFR